MSIDSRTFEELGPFQLKDELIKYARSEGESHSAVPGLGYPVPLAITTVALSVVAYFFALLA